MESEYFSENHETLEIFNQYPILVEMSKKYEFGLEEDLKEHETLIETLKRKKFDSDEIDVIIRKMIHELDKLYHT